MQTLTNIVKRKYIVTVEVTVDRDQVTDTDEAVNKIEDTIDNEMHYFNESLLPGSVADIIDDHLILINKDFIDPNASELEIAYRNSRINVDVDVTESTWYLDQIESETNSLS